MKTTITLEIDTDLLNQRVGVGGDNLPVAHLVDLFRNKSWLDDYITLRHYGIQVVEVHYER